jgi:protocatechuate 3,4-dioxygenase beta subunit
MNESTKTRGSLTAATGPGPFYISNAPQLVGGRLNYTGLPGEPIAITGHVYGGPEDSRPLPGAKVEIWQSDASGSYHPPASGDANRFAVQDLALRGYVVTGADGNYAFSTIYPGSYPGRTRHIHVRASAEGYNPVVTQIIVPPRTTDFIAPDEDFVAHTLPEANRVMFAEREGIPTASFDFHLAPR